MGRKILVAIAVIIIVLILLMPIIWVGNRLIYQSEFFECSKYKKGNVGTESCMNKGGCVKMYCGCDVEKFSSDDPILHFGFNCPEVCRYFCIYPDKMVMLKNLD